MDPALPEPVLNRAADELLARLADGENVLYRAAARPDDTAPEFSRAVPVSLSDGRSAVVRSRTRPSGPGSGAVVSVLELDHETPTLRGPFRSALSPRECEVAELVAVGLTDREIAERLILSPHTVRHHVKRVYQKLDVRSRVELARLAHPSS
ncbi:MAG: helix-turn-helix transcriptional regulator [Actinobacteria bacterium]|nr:helix-turn-helix transcriptional regulator [Actinomycetota bacterium]